MQIPNNIKAEQHIISALLFDQKTIEHYKESALLSDDFYDNRHKIIIESINNMISNNEPVDLILLTENIANRNMIEKCGGMDYISSILDAIPTSANMKYYCEVVKEKSVARQSITLANELLSDIHENNIDIYENLKELSEKIDSLKNKRESEIIIHDGSEILKSNLVDGLYVEGIKTGHDKIDWITGGLRNQELIIIAGRPGDGKTAFCTDLIAKNNDLKKVGIFSAEMRKELIMNRILSSKSAIDNAKIQKINMNNLDHLGNREKEILSIAANTITNMTIKINDISNIDIDLLCITAEKMKKKYDIDILIVDYLQLLSVAKDMRKLPRHEQIEYISRTLKGLAKKLDIPIIALAQLNREIEKRGDSMPKLSDLKDSGSIEQDADVIMFLHTIDKGDNTNRTDIIVAKDRNHKIGKSPAIFEKSYSRFTEISDL